VQEGFGTCDFDFIADEIIEVIDLKYGQSPAGRIYGDDPQLTFYALGAYLRAKKENPYHVTEIIRRTVYQPRLRHIHTAEMTLAELLAWAEEIKPKALEAWQGSDRYVPGDHCRWCKIAGTCKALASVNLRHAKMTDPAQMTPDEVSAALHAARQIKAWAKSVENFAFNTAKSGKIIPGWKIVEGSGKRKILRVTEAIDRLRMHADDGSKYLEPMTLLGITALEKNFGKKGLAAILGDLIERPPGAPKLVPDSDARPVKGSVESDFAGEQWNHLEINEEDLPF
jgi:hypothetical protein